MRKSILFGVAASFTVLIASCSDGSSTTEEAVSEVSPETIAASQPVAADGTPIAPPRCDYGAPHPNAPEELSQFDFLIGDYTIQFHAWRNGAWTPPQPNHVARWNGWYGLNGMAIYDEWYDPDPAIDPDGGRGVNVRYYDPNSSEWKMMWVDTSSAQVQDLRAEMRDGTLTMWQVYPERPNFLATFETIDADNWHRISYVPDEAGGWAPQFKIAATRIPCE